MKSSASLCFIFCVVLVGCGKPRPNELTLSHQSRIVNGVVASDVASLEGLIEVNFDRSVSNVCAGAVVSPHIVLVDAACPYYQQRNGGSISGISVQTKGGGRISAVRVDIMDSYSNRITGPVSLGGDNYVRTDINLSLIYFNQDLGYAPMRILQATPQVNEILDVVGFSAPSKRNPSVKQMGKMRCNGFLDPAVIDNSNYLSVNSYALGMVGNQYVGATETAFLLRNGLLAGIKAGTYEKESQRQTNTFTSLYATYDWISRRVKAYEPAEIARHNPAISGDVNHDGVVDSTDLNLLNNAIIETKTRIVFPPQPGRPFFDVNGDGVISNDDYYALQKDLNTHMGSYRPNLPYTNVSEPCDVNGDGAVTEADAQLVILAAKRALAGVSDVLQKSLPNRLDVNGDGQVTAADAIWITKQLRGQNSPVLPQ